MFPGPDTVATSVVPSADDAMVVQLRLLSLAIHVPPLSVEMYIWPPLVTAASLVPSEEEVIELSGRLRVVSRGVQTLRSGVGVQIAKG